MSHEHPETLERTAPRAEDEAPVREAMRRLKATKAMRVHSAAGTDLQVSLEGARVGGVWGFTTRPGSLSHWPGGLVLGLPGGRRGARPSGAGPRRREPHLQALPAGPRDIALIEDDHVVSIDGDSVDADLTRGYFEAWATARPMPSRTSAGA